MNISVLPAPGWKTPTRGGGMGWAQPRQLRQRPGPLSAFPRRGISGPAGRPVAAFPWGRKDSAPAGGSAARRGEAGSGDPGAGRLGGRGGAARPRRGDGAGDGLRAGGCPPGRGTGLGDVRVPARALEIKHQGGKDPGASFYFILDGVRPPGMAQLSHACFPPVPREFLFSYFSPRSASDNGMSLVQTPRAPPPPPRATNGARRRPPNPRCPRRGRAGETRGSGDPSGEGERAQLLWAALPPLPVGPLRGWGLGGGAAFRDGGCRRDTPVPHRSRAGSGCPRRTDPAPRSRVTSPTAPERGGCLVPTRSKLNPSLFLYPYIKDAPSPPPSLFYV